MTLTDLEARLGQNISLSTTQWAFAWLLGEARRRSNRARARTSDRGASGNEAVDLNGALGELLLFGMMRELGDSDAVEHSRRQLYIADGGRAASGPDVSFTELGRHIGIDVKTFDCSPNKRFFAINDNKHEQLRNQCIGYIGLVCPAFAASACLTRVIPYSDVSRWERRILRANGTASRNLPIEELMRLYCSEPYDIAQSRQRVYPKALIIDEALTTGSGSLAQRLIGLIPEIEPAIRAIAGRTP